MKIHMQVLRIGYLAAIALATGSPSVAATSGPAAPERPFGGSCSAVVTRLTDPGVFPEVLHVELDCILEHMGRVLGVATTTVIPAGPPVGQTLPIVLTSITTYEAANGDLLDQTFYGTGEVNPVTLEVTFEGMETFAGGTGRFDDAVASLTPLAMPHSSRTPGS